MKTIYTRKEYLSEAYEKGEAAHRKYYGQFVTPATISTVVYAIGAEKIRASINEHFNDIPLIMWDRIAPMLPGSGGFREAGDYYTLANGVCLAKEAARQWLETQGATK